MFIQKARAVIFVTSLFTALEAAELVKDSVNKDFAVKALPYFLAPKKNPAQYLALKENSFVLDSVKTANNFFWFSESAGHAGFQVLTSGPEYPLPNHANNVYSNSKLCLVKRLPSDEQATCLVQISLAEGKNPFLAVDKNNVSLVHFGQQDSENSIWIIISAYDLQTHLNKIPSTTHSLPFYLPAKDAYSNQALTSSKLKSLLALTTRLELELCEQMGDTFLCRAEGIESFCITSSEECILFIENMGSCWFGEGENPEQARNNPTRNNDALDTYTLKENRSLYYEPLGSEGWKKYVSITMGIGIRKEPNASAGQATWNTLRSAVGANKQHLPIVHTGTNLSLEKYLQKVFKDNQKGSLIGSDYLLSVEKIGNCLYIKISSSNKSVVTNPGNAAFLGELVGKTLINHSAEELKNITDQFAKTVEDFGIRIERATSTASTALKDSSHELSSAIVISALTLQSSFQHASEIFETSVVTLQKALRGATQDLQETARILSETVTRVSSDLTQNLEITSRTVENSSHEAAQGLRDASQSFTEAFKQVSEDLGNLQSSTASTLEKAIKAFKEGTETLAKAARKFKPRVRFI